MENQELIKVEASQSLGMFSSKDAFEHVQRVATMFSKSDMVPKRYQNNVGNCIIALEMATRMQASPLMVMQNLDVILGKPAWSSKFLIATLNASGKFSPLRYEDSKENGGSVRAWALDLRNNQEVFGAWVSMNMAKAEGWTDKAGSKWKTMPELMIRYRAASFFTNQFAPEVSMGLQTVEEVYDIAPVQAEKRVIDKSTERIQLMIDDCQTLPELEALQLSNPDIDIALFNARKSQILDNQ